MSILLQETDSVRQGKSIRDDINPISIHYFPNDVAQIHFDTGEIQAASCLNCFDIPCMKFKEYEVSPLNFQGYPADTDLNVCATGAIFFNDLTHAPEINPESCITCGVCASRCPIGAISLSDTRAHINLIPNPVFIPNAILSRSKNQQDLNKFQMLERTGTMCIESDLLVENFIRKLKKYDDKLPNLLARNLLIGAGISTTMKRKGNNSMRMDLILSSDYFQSFAEVEFGQEAVLDAPRDLLDGLAVLISRYGWNKQNIHPLIISDVLPNKRSEYWHIIEDIDKVLNIKVGTITIFLLMLLNWNKKNIEQLIINNCFYFDKKNSSYKEQVIEHILGRQLNIKNSSSSHIDIAK